MALNTTYSSLWNRVSAEKSSDDRSNVLVISIRRSGSTGPLAFQDFIGALGTDESVTPGEQELGSVSDGTVTGASVPSPWALSA